jgi:parvulin-like peptidyl-prolyl isomerase
MDAVFKAKEGELLGPIRAVDGWYLVLVEKRTPAPTFEQCAARVRDDLIAEAVSGWKLAIKSDPAVKISPDI